MSRLRNERGVAMITVLLIGAVMTVVVASASLIAIQEYRAANQDRGGTKALAYAEAGIDRTILWLRSNKTTWKNIVLSGCGTVAGSTYTTVTLNGAVPAVAGSSGAGTYSATISRADNCNPVPTAVPSPRVAQQLVITSDGCVEGIVGATCPTGNAERVVKQAISVIARQLPVGASASKGIDMRGSPSFRNMIIFSKGIVTTRKQMTVTGTDPYYKKSDFYPCSGSAVPGTGSVYRCYNSTNDAAMPASVHTTDRIFNNPNGGNVHPPSPNCSYPWDGSATGVTIATNPGGTCTAGPSGVPPTANFSDSDYARIAQDPRLTEEDQRYFKQVAQQSGLYCGNYNPAAGTNSCTRAGVAATNVTGDIDPADVTGLGNFFVVYVEFPSTTNPMSNSLGWNVPNPINQSPCSSTAAATSSILLIVRNGGVTSKTAFLGAIFAEDGVFETNNITFEGALATAMIRTRGNPTICNSQRWIDAMPGAFLRVTPLDWSEVDAG